MAAGMSSRFVPLSLEKPKGLLVVKNEVLIERQIEQLLEAGIEDIIVVLGYKKEAFFYLQEKYNIQFIINPEFNTKNNIHTLYLAQKHIGNTYICSSKIINLKWNINIRQNQKRFQYKILGHIKIGSTKRINFFPYCF